MDCKEFKKYLPEMFDLRPGPLRNEMIEHMEACAQCSRIYENWHDTVQRLTPSTRISPSKDFKERIMHQSKNHDLAKDIQACSSFRRWQKALFAAAAVVLLALTVSLFSPSSLFREKLDPNNPQQLITLVSQALAAQQELIYSAGITHLVVKHVIPDMTNEQMAVARWKPFVSVRPDGELQHNRVMTRAKPGESYTVREELFYDSHSGRFVKIISYEERVIYACSYDGARLLSLGMNEDHSHRVVTIPADPGFETPVALVNSMAAHTTWDSLFNKQSDQIGRKITTIGEQILSDGEPVRVIKLDGITKVPVDTYVLMKIRKSDNTLAERELFVQGESSSITRYPKVEKKTGENIPWNLEGLSLIGHEAAGNNGISLDLDVIRSNISDDEMVSLSDIPVYGFSSSPSWCLKKSTTFLCGFGSLGVSFQTALRATPGGSHIVLSQAKRNSIYSRMKKQFELIHTASNGIKIYSMNLEQSKWLAKIMLSASFAVLNDKPGPDRMSYRLETPQGTWCSLTTNTTLTDMELFALVDKLVILSN